MSSLSKSNQGMNKTKGFYKQNNYTAITQGCAYVLKCLFEIYHGKDGLESFCKKYELDPRSLHAYLNVCNLPAPVCKLFKKIGWFYESKLGYSIYIKYPIMVTKNILTLQMSLLEFAEKHKLNKTLVRNFFSETPILSSTVLEAVRKEGLWYECYTKTPLELRQLAKERINDEEGGLSSYIMKINFPHRDTYWDYFDGIATSDKLEKRLRLDGYLVR